MPDKTEKLGLYPKVGDLYNGKSVLITGAAGFVGMIILETLLRTCPGINSIYILLRAKKGVQPEQRMEKLFQKVIFEELEEKQPGILSKVRLVSGDVSQPDLGMSQEHVEDIIQNVSIVFHCAADISFVKSVKYIMGVNALGTFYVVQLCKKLKEIEALVFTSTICSNCNRKEKIEEEVYRLPFPSDRFLEEWRNGTDESLEELVSLCHPHWPNSYTFSKCLAENILLENSSEVPCTIIRPSVVGSTWKAPHPGFCEKKSTLILLCTAAGKGFIKILLVDPDNEIDFLPADVVANAHVVAAWKIATGRSKAPFIVNGSCYGIVSDTWQEFTDVMVGMTKTYPLPNSFRTPTTVQCIENFTKYRMLTFYEHYVPAYVFDLLLKLSGHKFRMVPLYQLFDKAMLTATFFTFNRSKYETINFRTLEDQLDEEDKKKFYTDISDISLQEVIQYVPLGNELYNWKNDKKTKEQRMKKADQRHQFSQLIKYAFLIIMFTVLYLFISKTSQLIGIL